MAPSRHDWKIVDWDVKPQHNQPTTQGKNRFSYDEVQIIFKDHKSSHHYHHNKNIN